MNDCSGDDAGLWRADRLDTRLYQGRLDARQLRALARALAARQADAPAADEVPSAASPESLVRRARAQGRQLAAALPGEEAPAAVLAWQLRTIQTESDVLEARVRAGRVRAGSAELDLARGYVDAQLRVVLADPPPHAKLRAADAVDDVAQLAVALRSARRDDLAERFVAAFAEQSLDFGLYRVLALYESLAATARAVAACAAGRIDAAQRLLAYALPRSVAGRPRLVAVGGVMASGKSTVATRLAAKLGAPVVASDRIRQALVAARGGDWTQGLAPGFAFAIYREMARAAEAVLDSGRSVVLDGCFRSRAMRAAARHLAAARGLPFLFLECRAEDRTVRRRLAARSAAEPCEHPGGWNALYDTLLREWEPVVELSDDEHVRIETSRAAPRGLERVVRALPPTRELVA